MILLRKIFQTLFAYVCHSLKMLQFRTANFFTYFLPVYVKIWKKCREELYRTGETGETRRERDEDKTWSINLASFFFFFSFFMLYIKEIWVQRMKWMSTNWKKIIPPQLLKQLPAVLYWWWGFTVPESAFKWKQLKDRANFRLLSDQWQRS